MEIGPLQPHEGYWLLARSVATAWAQLTPAEQAVTAPDALGARIQAMLARALAAPGGAALVARDQGAPVGYLVVTVVPDELTGMATGLFADIWVEPDRRGTGAARQLTAAGDAYCRALGVTRVRRAVAAHNAPSLRLCLADGCQVERLVLAKDL